jgi:transcriptional regulator of heat shock response
MLRIEMERLTEEGLLWQPFVSAGRIPTDKAYRFFVNGLLEKEGKDQGQNYVFHELNTANDSLSTLHSLTKDVARLTSTLTLGFWPAKDLLLKEGWGEIIKEPEFESASYLSNLAQLVELWEQGLLERPDFPENLQVWIGQENPYPQAKEFSALASQCLFPAGQKGILVIFGPKRMNYSKNIRILNSLNKAKHERGKPKTKHRK